MPKKPPHGNGAEKSSLSDRIWGTASKGNSVQIVKSPPGAGKTHTLLGVAKAALTQGKRVAVACQTNSQADDVAMRACKNLDSDSVVRLLSTDAAEPQNAPYRWLKKVDEIDEGPIFVVGTSAKWGAVKNAPHFDILLIDEAWQLQFSSFLPLLHVSANFVLIGDPGQIPPVVSTPGTRWETSRHPPHLPAPEVLIERLKIDLHRLPSTWRLPSDTARIVRAFYDFEFDSIANPNDRVLTLQRSTSSSLVHRSLDRLCRTSISTILLPTPREGGIPEADLDVAEVCVEAISSALARKARVTASDGTLKYQDQLLVPKDFGVACTHRSMVHAIRERLAAKSAKLAEDVMVDTAERWQGLERHIMIAVHPLSSVLEPSEFDIGVGRLCVMASRHRHGLIMIGRDHINDTLERMMPSARQPLGRRDEVALGLTRHREFWASLTS